MNATIPEHIRELALKYLNGTITPEEKDQFDAWYQSQPAEELVWDDPSVASEAALQQLIFKNIQAQQQRQVKPLRTRFLQPAAAAAAILAIAIAVLWWQRPVTTVNKPQPVIAVNDKAPGKTGAILVLGDGSSVALDEAATGQLAVQGATRLTNGKGKLVYTGGAAGSEAVVQNTVMTPAGRQYQLVLPDGTSVWLNAASAVSFPTAFTGSSREIELKGEAYFEVAAGHTPFMVKANGTMVQVLGTHFNVNAYADEAGVRTTLLQGAVKVIKGQQQRLIRPGQQALVPEEGEKITIADTDTEIATAWMGNEFVFRQTDIKTVMRQIARWYDMEVEYKGDMKGITITGNVSRTVYASSLLKALELTRTVQCKIEGRRIIVMPHAL